MKLWEHTASKILILSLIVVAVFGLYYLSNANTNDNKVNIETVTKLSHTQLKVPIPSSLKEKCSYLIVMNENKETETFPILEKLSDNIKITLTKFKCDENSRITVTIYDKDNDPIAEYKEL